MATEYPPLNKIHVVGYSANDNNFPILNLVADPRVAGYKVPEDLSACPDKRYPNHVFTGAQPISGDQRVRHTWEILPSPWVPFTRYDDDLGPIQGRRRSVKNEGQKASLTSSTKISYEGREGSAIVSTELEETWSIKTDSDGNSLFPVRVRDFYDASRGPVEETRQLFVPTGEEEGTIENINGVITQTSYEAYNEFLSFKIVQKYKVDGPQLIGKQTNNEGQLATVTTQRKASDNYTPPQPTATRTVEASREDAESLIERIVDVPEVFEGKTLTLEKPDVTPQKFQAVIPSTSKEVTVEGTVEDPIILTGNEISKSEQQATLFTKRVRTIERDPASEATITGAKVYTSELGGGIANITETYSSSGDITADLNTVSVSSEALGDGKFVGQKVELPTIPTLVGQDYDDLLDIVFPYTQTVVPTLSEVPEDPEDNVDLAPKNNLQTVKRTRDREKIREALLAFDWRFGAVVNISLPDILSGVKVVNSISVSGGYTESEPIGVFGNTTLVFGGTYSSIGNIVYDIKEGYTGPVNANRHIFYMDRDSATLEAVTERLEQFYGVNNVKQWPKTRPIKHTLIVTSGTIQVKNTRLWTGTNVIQPEFTYKDIVRDENGQITTTETIIPPTLHDDITIESVDISISDITPPPAGKDGPPSITPIKPLVTLLGSNPVEYDKGVLIPKTEPASFSSGNYIASVEIDPYKFGLVRVSAMVALITSNYVS